MKKIFLLMPVFISIMSFSFAGDLRFFVFDKELDLPLEGVQITLAKGGKNNKHSSAEQEKAVVFSDEEGNAVLNIPDEITSGEILAFLPGYEPASVKFNGTEKTVEIAMSISSVIEGKELVVKRAAPDTAEEKVGVSTVMTQEEMKTTAKIGLVEDTMASVRTLPGVSFGGVLGQEPSFRGGAPREAGYLLDGMYLLFPYHWGGLFSYFAPQFVDSVKLSHGIFSAKYGRASSGLLEASSIKPDYENFHADLEFATCCTDAFFQIPFGKDVGGMILGIHLSYLDTLKWAGLLDESMGIERAPYIRDFFFKTSFTPVPELDVSVVGIFGTDGIGYNFKEDEKNIKTHTVLDYDMYQTVLGFNIKYLASDTLLLHGLLSYNGIFEDTDLNQTESGSVKFNTEFIDRFGPNGAGLSGVTAGASYNLSDFDIDYKEKINNHLVTGRFESEIELTEKNHLCVGAEETFQASGSDNSFNGWVETKIPGTIDGYLFEKVNYSQKINTNCIFDHAVFASWTFGEDSDFMQTEAGLRGEFISLHNFDDDYTVNFVPDLCPRASVTFTPWKDIGSLEKASLTFGSGLFSSIPRETMLFTKEMGIKNFDIKANRVFTGVIGAQASLYGGWNFKLETYGKYYLSRIFTYEKTEILGALTPETARPVERVVETDGKGYAFGIDSMIEKKIGGKWDGYVSYSYIYSRLKNPAEIKSTEYVETDKGTPLNEWYYPNYHRFHTMNLVSNFHFGKGWTFTVKGTVATGTPKEKTGDVICYAAFAEDGSVIQRYTRSSVYSDTLRTSISCPIDLRISREWKSKSGKVSKEFYFGVQDVFATLYTPKGDKSFNQYTGEMSDAPENADFSLGIPIPSFGIKIKY